MSSNMIPRFASLPDAGVLAACDVTTIEPIELQGLPIISGYQVKAGDRVFNRFGSEIGIFVASTVNWARATDWNSNEDLRTGVRVPVSNPSYTEFAVFFNSAFNANSIDFAIVPVGWHNDNITAQYRVDGYVDAVGDLPDNVDLLTLYRVGNHEYFYGLNGWVDLGEVSGGTVNITNSTTSSGGGSVITFADKADAVENFDSSVHSTATILSDDGGDFIYKETSDYPDTLASAVSTYTGTACGVAIDLGAGKGFLVRKDLDGFISAKWFKVLLGNNVNAVYALDEAIEYARLNFLNVFCPKGIYSAIGTNFRLGNPTATATELKEYNNILIYTEEGTVFRTSSDNGADVFQIGATKNLKMKIHKIMADITGANPSAGSNGISLTSGFDNIDIEVYAEGLHGTDKPTYVDGGDALTIQASDTALPCGSLRAKVHAKDCAESFSMDAFVTNMSTKDTNIQVEAIAEDCYRAVNYAGTNMTGPLSADYDTGITIDFTAINCQKDVSLQAAHGLRIEGSIVSTKPKAELIRTSTGRVWHVADQDVVGVYHSNCNNVVGNFSGSKKYCDYKVRIGGGVAESSGQGGYSQFNTLFYDIGGEADINDVGMLVDVDGTIRDSTINFSHRTCDIIPASILLRENGNTTTLGTKSNLHSPTVVDKLTLAAGPDGQTPTAEIKLGGTGYPTLKGLTAVANADIAFGLQDSNGALRLAIRNSNGLIVDGISTGAAIGAYKGKFAVYNPAGTLLGYFPLYN